MKEKKNIIDIAREGEFIRSSILDNRELCLQSWCGDCGFTIFAGSVYDLVEEDRHRHKCALKQRMRARL